MLEISNFTQNEIDGKMLKRVARVVLEMVEVKDKTEISLAIVGDGRMRRLNKMYRGRNRVTDVLSFGNKSVLQYLSKAFPRLKKGEDIKFVEAPDGVNRLGEIIICYPRAKKQAKRAGHSLKKEMTILLIHGILHLLGYDHEKNKEETERMEEMEKRILSEISKSNYSMMNKIPISQ